ncbi:MAG: 16S rRNA (adenine(1518)-N(6)/adenine(1519)-N(6))-dimethyltransferase RsmA [Oscillospiraceae bacterium]
MYNLSSPSTIKELLERSEFSFKKSLGQNFLINPDVCPQMAEDAVTENDMGVLEIGPGIGVLTAELSKVAKKVVAIELDERLGAVLAETLKDYNNIELVFGDAMKLDLNKIISEKFQGMNVCVCANLPYYITSPLIMMLLESRLPVESITVMVQKEAALRICAPIGDRKAGAVSVAVQYYSVPQLLFHVPSSSFMPAPKVDSAVIKLQVRKAPEIDIKSEKDFFKLVKAGFSQRRKTLVNSVSSMLSIDKSRIAEALRACGINEDVRIEKLTMQQLAQLTNELW